jgi:transcription initiation factor TFIIIB Brf1 subunit/transcription initiation factor TFIIB
MPSQHFVPKFATTVRASSRTQANALKALALAGVEPAEPEWRSQAAAALLIGAMWAGEKHTEAELAEAAGVPEKAVAKHYADLAERLKNIR